MAGNSVYFANKVDWLQKSTEDSPSLIVVCIQSGLMAKEECCIGNNHGHWNIRLTPVTLRSISFALKCWCQKRPLAVTEILLSNQLIIRNMLRHVLNIMIWSYYIRRTAISHRLSLKIPLEKRPAGLDQNKILMSIQSTIHLIKRQVEYLQKQGKIRVENRIS
jgi:hypothetical protein